MRSYQNEEMVLGGVLREQAATRPDRVFLRFDSADLTFHECNQMVNRVAHGLTALGVGQGDKVAIMLPNCPEFLYLTFALGKLGAVAVPINTAYKGDLLEHIIVSSDSAFLVIEEEWVDRAAAVPDALARLRAVVVRAPRGAAANGDGLGVRTVGFESLVTNDTAEPGVEVSHGDLQAIMYTSGTTGASKGVMVSHAHAMTCGLDWLTYTAFQEDEVVYCPLPLFHGVGLWCGVMAVLLSGSTICVVDRFSASSFWSDVRRFKANVSLGIFSMIPILLNQPPRPDDKDHTLRAFYLGQSAMDEPLNERFGVRSVEIYGSTELGIGTGSPYGAWRPGSCGQVNTDSYEIRIVDEWDRETPPGVPGEIVARPVKPFVMTTGYYNFPAETVAAFRNLWFHTGDRAYRDEDGYLFFVDRVKDAMRRRGENISSFEVERGVNAHPSVLESAAVAVPSELGEDDVKICVVLQPGKRLAPEELLAFCEERMAYFMVPRYVEFIDALPKTPTEKVEKYKLRNEGVTPATWDREQVGYKVKRG